MHTLYYFLFLLIFTLWLGLTLFVIVDRIRYDRDTRSLNHVLARLGKSRPVMLTAEARSRVSYPLITRLPQPVVLRIASGAGLSNPVSEVFAEHALARWGFAGVFAAASGVARSNDPWQRISALSVLTQTRADCIHDLLTEALQDPNLDVSASAVILLGRLQDIRAAGLLVLALRNKWVLASSVARQLDIFRIPINHLLEPLLASADPQVRYWAVTLLARYRGDSQLNAKLADMARDPDPAIRKAVAQSLGQLGASREAVTVLQLLYDNIAYVRCHAVQALAKMNRPEFAGSVAGMLSDPEWRVQSAAREALQSMAQPALPDRSADFSFMQELAAAGLGNLNRPYTREQAASSEAKDAASRPAARQP